MDHPHDDCAALSRTFADLAELAFDCDVGECVHLLAHTAAQVAGADTGGVLLSTHSGRLEIAATLSTNSVTVEALEVRTDSGPCVEAARTGQVVSVPDLHAATDRWPAELLDPVDEMGIRAAYAQPIRFRETAIGALNLYWADVHDVPPAVRDIVAGLADVVAIGITQQRTVMGQEQHTAHLRQAFETRTLVEQAKGILADRHGITPAQAFGAMRRYARDHRVRVGEVSQQLIDTVQEPSTPLGEKIADRIDG